MEGGSNMSRRRALHSKPDPAADHKDCRHGCWEDPKEHCNTYQRLREAALLSRMCVEPEFLRVYHFVFNVCVHFKQIMCVLR